MTVTELEKAITELSNPDFVKFSKWFSDYEAKIWDEKIEKDLASGRLDKILKEAEEEYQAGKAEPL